MLSFEMIFEVFQVIIAFLADAVPDIEGGGVGEVLVHDPVCIVIEGCGAMLADGTAVDW
jgi:hypothetical protein